MSTATSPPADAESRILTAAHQVFLRAGTHGARMQEIADEAGVNKALLHYYFRSKEKLVEQVYISTASKLFPKVFQIVVAELPLLEKIEAMVTTLLDTVIANPYIPGYILSEFHYNRAGITKVLSRIMPDIGERQQMFKVLQSQLDHAAEIGEIRPTLSYDFVISIMALVIFPMAGAPMTDFLWGTGDAERTAFFARQRATLAHRFLASLRPIEELLN